MALIASLWSAGAPAQGAAKAQKGPPVILVTIATVEQLTVPYRIRAIGNVEASSTVAIKARVDGQIVDVGFKEGQPVRAGQMLFRIDPRPFEATLRQAEATHQRDRAQMEQARSQERRYQELLEKNFVSKEAYAQIRTNADTAEAVANASKASVDNARLQLEYCTIRSPIAAYPGKINIQKGNLVRANDTVALVSLNQVHPIYVNFAVPEQQLPSIRAYMKKGAIGVEATAPNGTSALAAGTLVFVDNAVDQTTGTIRLRAQFQNKDDVLWPGQFVNASLNLYEQRDALVVPTQSVQTGPAGQFVFVVKPDMTAEVRNVTVERSDGDNSIIAKGLQKGERVVTRGHLRIAPGAKLTVKSQ